MGTGAIRCVVPPHVVQELGLQIIGQRVAEYADGRLEAVGITEPFSLRVLDREEMETALVLGDEVIVGLTALERMDLLVDPINRRLIPNPDHPDQPVTKLKYDFTNLRGRRDGRVYDLQIKGILW